MADYGTYGGGPRLRPGDYEPNTGSSAEGAGADAMRAVEAKYGFGGAAPRPGVRGPLPGQAGIRQSQKQGAREMQAAANAGDTMRADASHATFMASQAFRTGQPFAGPPAMAGPQMAGAAPPNAFERSVLAAHSPPGRPGRAPVAAAPPMPANPDMQGLAASAPSNAPGVSAPAVAAPIAFGVNARANAMPGGAAEHALDGALNAADRPTPDGFDEDTAFAGAGMGLGTHRPYSMPGGFASRAPAAPAYDPAGMAARSSFLGSIPASEPEAAAPSGSYAENHPAREQARLAKIASAQAAQGSGPGVSPADMAKNAAVFNSYSQALAPKTRPGVPAPAPAGGAPGLDPALAKTMSPAALAAYSQGVAQAHAAGRPDRASAYGMEEARKQTAMEQEASSAKASDAGHAAQAAMFKAQAEAEKNRSAPASLDAAMLAELVAKGMPADRAVAHVKDFGHVAAAARAASALAGPPAAPGGTPPPPAPGPTAAAPPPLGATGALDLMGSVFAPDEKGGAPTADESFQRFARSPYAANPASPESQEFMKRLQAMPDYENQLAAIAAPSPFARSLPGPLQSGLGLLGGHGANHVGAFDQREKLRQFVASATGRPAPTTKESPAGGMVSSALAGSALSPLTGPLNPAPLLEALGMSDIPGRARSAATYAPRAAAAGLAGVKSAARSLIPMPF